MVEAENNNADVKNDAFVPSDEEKALIAKHLGDQAIIDPKYKANVLLSKE